MSKKKQIKGNWIVRMECTLIKKLCVSNCTEDEARNTPFKFAVQERDMDMPDWEVQSVEPNE